MKKSKKDNKKGKSKKTALHSDTKRSIVAVACFAFALITLLSIFGLAGIFGSAYLSITKILFGQGFFLVPIGLVLAGLALIVPQYFSKVGSGKRKHLYIYTFLGVGLFILSLLSIFHLFSPASKAGGYLGMILGWPGLKFLGTLGSSVIFLAILVISILVTFNISLKKKIVEEDQKDSTDQKEADQKLPLAKQENDKFSFWQKIKGLTSTPKIKVKQDGKVKEVTPAIGKSNPVEDKEQAPAGSKEALATLGLTSAKGLKKPKLTNIKLPTVDILEGDKGQPTSGDIKANLNIIKRTLENFGIEVEMAEVNVGPTVTQYTLRPAHGVKLSRIIALQNDLALSLAAHPIRIEAPIPGRSLVGLELPNKSVVMVRLRNLLDNPTLKEASSTLILALGRNVAGNPVYADLAKMPHLLIAGATGTGKTIAINNIISSLLFQNSIETLRMILVDPKRVEFTAYNGIPHLLTPVIVQNQKAVNALRWALGEMDRRFNVLQEEGARDIASYNSKADDHLPYIVIVIDELADIMASCGREVEASIVRLAQMSRAVGIHLIVATQRPSVEVITGLIKANITTRMAFQVASQIDSRTILDMGGAEKLLGNGDMLFVSASSAKPRRIQGTFISEKEVSDLAEYWRNSQDAEYDDAVVDSSSVTVMSAGSGSSSGEGAEDELYEEAKDVVAQAGKASASLLQRRLRVGYARAARLLDVMEDNGIIGPADGAKPREVYDSEPVVSQDEPALTQGEQENIDNVEEEQK